MPGNDRVACSLARNVMKLLFLRLYFALFLSLVISALGLDFLYARFQRDEPQADALQWLWLSQQPVADAATRLPGGHWLPLSALHWPEASHRQLQEQRSLQLQDADGNSYFYGLSSDGKQVYVLAMPISAGEHRHWYWLFAYYATLALVIFLWLRPLVRDIDKLRHAVQALDLPTTELTIPVQQRSALTPVADALRDLRQHTVELMALQRDIADAVSHDIRTPLARIRFALAMLSAEADHQLIASIQADLGEIDQLVNELLRYAEFEHRVPVLQKQSIALRDFVEALVQRYQHHQNIRITVRIATDTTLLFDRLCLQRLLQNLLDNAFRYASSQIAICCQHDATGLLLSVEDDGPGIAGSDEQDVSAAFVIGTNAAGTNVRGTGVTETGVTETNASGTERAGYGLGLAIVRKIALWHGGSLALERSVLLGGARIVVRLPVD